MPPTSLTSRPAITSRPRGGRTSELYSENDSLMTNEALAQPSKWRDNETVYV